MLDYSVSETAYPGKARSSRLPGDTLQDTVAGSVQKGASAEAERNKPRHQSKQINIEADDVAPSIREAVSAEAALTPFPNAMTGPL